MPIKYLFTLLFFALFIAAYPQTSANTKTGEVKGVIINKKDRTPIAGAKVMVVNDTISAITDSVGAYKIEHIKTGYATLYIEADGFSGLITGSFLVTTSTPAVVNAELSENTINVDNVVVSASLFVPTTESPVSLRRIGPEEIDMTPGANRDISKVVQSAPGVLAVNSANRNDVLVRGGGANENKYYIDGIEIPVLNHFAVQGGSGGNASLVNTDLLSSVNFYTGAFPTQYANALSSVMDMQMKRGNSERFHGKLILGASDVGLSVDTPISKNGKTTFTGSFRRSYLQMLFSVIGLPFLPTYNDYQFKLSSKLSDQDEIYVIGLGSFDKNRLNLSLKDPDESKQYITGYLPEMNQTSSVFGAGYIRSFTGGQFRVTASRDKLKNAFYKYEDNNESLPRILDIESTEENYRLRTAVNLWDLGGFRFSAGVGAGAGSYRSEAMRRIFTDNFLRETTTDGAFDIARYEFFATLNRYFFDDKLSVMAGLRGDGMSYSSHTSNPFKQLAPKISVSYKLSSKLNFSASAARYYQEPSFTTIGYEGDPVGGLSQKDGLRYIAANHYIIGVGFAPNPQSDLRVEGFYKQYSQLPVSLLDSMVVSTGDFADYIVGDVPVRSVGKGRAYGAEFSYRHLNFHNTVINLSYTFLVSQVNRLDENLVPLLGYFSSSWDVRNIVNVSAIHKFGRNWTLGGKWSLTGGLPYTPYDEDLSSLVGAWDSKGRPYSNYDLYNDSRTPVYHQLDVRVDKTWFFKKWRLGFYVDIQNLYNYKTQGQDILMPQIDANRKYIKDPNDAGRYLMKRIPNDVGGTILPTLGITIEM